MSMTLNLIYSPICNTSTSTRILQLP